MSEATFDEQLGLRPGDVLADRYCVGRLIASGGMGYVVAATHRELGTPFAVKVLKVKYARDDTYLARFRREAFAAARLKSEHIVRVVDFGRVPDSGAPFLVMEHLEGQDLASLLSSARSRGAMLPLRDVCDYIIQACNGLAVAHAVGIVHRDLKPANLFLTRQPDGSPCIKVLDFGISKHGTGDDLALTAPREVLGSPIYMSPEQLKSPRAVDARSDIWSLGVILFELLTGRVPFDDREFGELFMRIQTEPAPPLLDLRPDLPAELGELVARCLQKDQAARFSNVAALAKELAAFASPGAQHYVNSTRRMNGQPSITQITNEMARVLQSGPPPADEDSGWPPDPRPPGRWAFARRLFGTKTLAPLAGDTEPSPAWRDSRRSRRVVLVSALAGIALGYSTWALVRHHGPTQALSRSLASFVASKLPGVAGPKAPPGAAVATAAPLPALAPPTAPALGAPSPPPEGAAPTATAEAVGPGAPSDAAARHAPEGAPSGAKAGAPEVASVASPAGPSAGAPASSSARSKTAPGTARPPGTKPKHNGPSIY
ncbi:MAG TPA: protein kinase [Polyangiaceae bacterium]|nr:protein kinase [Polyangiaceae bacterium]